MTTGLKGSLRLLAVLAVLLLATLAVVLLFGFLPAEVVADTAVKGLATLAIVALVALALGVLLGKPD